MAALHVIGCVLSQALDVNTLCHNRLRSSIWEKLQSLENSNEGTLSQILDRSLRRDPLYPILSADHLAAIDRRLVTVMSAVRQCIDSQGNNTVVVDSWG